MRPEIEFLHRIDSGRPSKGAQTFAERIFESAISEIKQNAYQSPYHRYVVAHGYPLPEHLIQNLFYVVRPEIEKEIVEAISRGRNIVLLGCEGSGKTTLIHRTCGTKSKSHNFLYIDTSDLGQTTVSKDFQEIVIERLMSALGLNSSSEDRKEFQMWVSELGRDDQYIALEFEMTSRWSYLVNFLLWLDLKDEDWFYVILDNIDSLSSEVAAAVFSVLNALGTAIGRRGELIGARETAGFRFLVACRTATFSHVVGISKGLFVSPSPIVIQAEDDIKRNIAIVDLLERFVTVENEDIFNSFRDRKEHIRLLSDRDTYQVTFSEYIRTVSEWLRNHSQIIDETIKPLCGRSLRRMKVYGIRLYASPIVATLALLESKKISSIGITRSDSAYFKRRVLEALFDFRIRGAIDATGTFGLPLNFFNVFQDDTDFPHNPLIGITALDRLFTCWDLYAAKDIAFAKSLDATEFINDLLAVGYSLSAIRQLFHAFAVSGLLRRAVDSEVIHPSTDGQHPLYRIYVADDAAIRSYHNLCFCAETRTSILYFNGAVRFKYDVGYYTLVDSTLLECLLNLIFIVDVAKREDQLAEMNKDSGIALRAYTSAIKSKLLSTWRSILLAERDRLTGAASRRASTSKALRFDFELLEVCEETLVRASELLATRETII